MEISQQLSSSQSQQELQEKQEQQEQLKKGQQQLEVLKLLNTICELYSKLDEEEERRIKTFLIGDSENNFFSILKENSNNESDNWYEELWTNDIFQQSHEMECSILEYLVCLCEFINEKYSNILSKPFIKFFTNEVNLKNYEYTARTMNCILMSSFFYATENDNAPSKALSLLVEIKNQWLCYPSCFTYDPIVGIDLENEFLFPKLKKKHRLDYSEDFSHFENGDEFISQILPLLKHIICKHQCTLTVAIFMALFYGANSFSTFHKEILYNLFCLVYGFDDQMSYMNHVEGIEIQLGNLIRNYYSDNDDE